MLRPYHAGLAGANFDDGSLKLNLTRAALWRPFKRHN